MYSGSYVEVERLGFSNALSIVRSTRLCHSTTQRHGSCPTNELIKVYASPIPHTGLGLRKTEHAVAPALRRSRVPERRPRADGAEVPAPAPNHAVEGPRCADRSTAGDFASYFSFPSQYHSQTSPFMSNRRSLPAVTPRISSAPIFESAPAQAAADILLPRLTPMRLSPRFVFGRFGDPMQPSTDGHLAGVVRISRTPGFCSADTYDDTTREADGIPVTRSLPVGLRRHGGAQLQT